MKAAVRSAGLVAGKAGGAATAPPPDACTSRVGELHQWASERAGDPFGPLAQQLLPLPPAGPAPGGFAAALRTVLSDPAYQLD